MKPVMTKTSRILMDVALLALLNRDSLAWEILQFVLQFLEMALLHFLRSVMIQTPRSMMGAQMV